jgi:serine protease inhibitor
MKRKWWHDKVVYQIYPKSFYDSNGDGSETSRESSASLIILRNWEQISSGFPQSINLPLQTRDMTLQIIMRLIRGLGPWRIWIV